MSQTAAAAIPIGPCKVYWNKVRLGSPMSQVAIRHTKETVQTRLPDTGVDVNSHKTGEVMEVDCVIADLKPAQLRYVYDRVADKDTPGTIDSTMYAAAGSTIMRFSEEVTLSGTSNSTLDQAKYITGTITVLKSDYSNAPTGYTKGTDFTSNGTAGTIARIAAGGISDGAVVVVQYNATSTCAIVYGGGGLSDFEAELLAVHELDNGKFLQLRLYRAKKTGASDWSIQMAAEFGGVPMTFRALADLTRAPGKQLFEIAVEA